MTGSWGKSSYLIVLDFQNSYSNIPRDNLALRTFEIFYRNRYEI